MYKQQNVLKHFRFECALSTSVCRGRRFYPLHSFLIQRQKRQKVIPAFQNVYRVGGGAETQKAEEKSHTEVSVGGREALLACLVYGCCVCDDIPSYQPIFLLSE